MKKNIYINNTCNSCQKKYNLNNHEIFNYCTNCNIFLCGKCMNNHDKKHLIIKSNKITTKCKIHPKNNNVAYCLDCNCHLCKECSKHRKHMRHSKQNIEDIEPSFEEINFLLKIINDYKNKMNSSEIAKQNKLVEIEDKYSKNKEKENEDYNKIILNTKKELENELTNSENKYNYEINEIKLKYEKEISEKKKIFDNNSKLINDKFKQINENNKNNYEKKLEILESERKVEIKKIENEFSQKIEQLNELIDINNIIYNTYNKNKENYYHNINIINILINYYEKGNEIVRDMKNNEDFMETISQKDYDLNKSRNEDFVNFNIIEKEKEKSKKDSIRNNKNSINIIIPTMNNKKDNINELNYINKKEDKNSKEDIKSTDMKININDIFYQKEEKPAFKILKKSNSKKIYSKRANHLFNTPKNNNISNKTIETNSESKNNNFLYMTNKHKTNNIYDINDYFNINKNKSINQNNEF